MWSRRRCVGHVQSAAGELGPCGLKGRGKVGGLKDCAGWGVARDLADLKRGRLPAPTHPAPAPTRRPQHSPFPRSAFHPPLLPLSAAACNMHDLIFSLYHPFPHDFQVTWPLFNSLQCFWPGMQSLLGDMEPAVSTLRAFHTLWLHLGFHPEGFSLASAKIQPGQAGYPLRPEHAESLFLVHRATGGDEWLRAGREVLRSLQVREARGVRPPSLCIWPGGRPLQDPPPLSSGSDPGGPVRRVPSSPSPRYLTMPLPPLYSSQILMVPCGVSPLPLPPRY
jgi:hypothetical protein